MAKFKVAFLLMYTCVASEAIKKWLFKTIMYVACIATRSKACIATFIEA